MKTLFTLLAVSLPLLGFSQTETPAPRLEVHEVQNIFYKDGEASVTLMDMGQVFRMDEEAKVIPCLWNGWRAPQKVLLKFDHEKEEILDCKLYAGGLLEISQGQDATKH